SLIMVDVDHFKRYNDTYGHAAGDICLKQVAAALNGVARRQGDIVARYGGEEFACILPMAGREQALKLARDVCDAVARLHLPHARSDASEFV
ncbi:GGDEF domain-containing protein, partial [Acinetobacter baumannii]